MTIESHATPLLARDRRNMERPSVALRKIGQATNADHVSLLRVEPVTERLEVVATAGTSLVAPGTEVSLTASALVSDATSGADGIRTICDCDAPFETLAGFAGLREGVAVPVAHSDGSPAGAVIVGWSADTAPLDHVREAVAVEDRALQSLLSPTTDLTHVVIAHEDAFVADGIARQAERCLGIEATACTSVAALLSCVAEDPPALVVCSERLGDEEALRDVVAHVRAVGCATPVMVLARAETSRSVTEALNAGVHGYATIRDGAGQIVDVIERLLAGEAVLPDPADGCSGPRLTDRELEVLKYLERGLSYQEIAAELHVALSTVKTHSRPLFRKLGVCSRSAAVHRGREEGLI